MLPISSLFAIFTFSFLLGLGAVISPGPVSAAIVTQAPRRGWIVGPLVASGHAFLELIIVVLISYGLTATLAIPAVRTGIALIGGLLLLWMGTTMIIDVWRKRIPLKQRGDNNNPLGDTQLFGLGVIATLSNPFWYAWWVTVAAGYLAQAQTLNLSSIGAFYFGHISADYAWDTALSAIVGRGRGWITPKIYAGMILLCGGFLIYLGVVFLLDGLTAFS